MAFIRALAFLSFLVLGAHAEQNNVAVSSSGVQFSVCADSAILVNDISVLCDSPGTYYYGSNKYRNNEYCQAGDKVKIQVDFYVNDEEQIAEAGGLIYVSLDVEGYGNVYDKSLYADAELCSLETLSSVNGAACPAQDYYTISTSFYWNSADDEDQFAPVLKVGFRSDLEKEDYDLGGANTDKCDGETAMSWSDSVKTTYANAFGSFVTTFGILIVVVVALALFVHYTWKRQDAVEAQEALIDEDFEKIQKVLNRKDMIDYDS